MSWLDEWGPRRPLVIGMLHLPPLAGAPRYGGDPRAVTEAALRDAACLAEEGVDALLLENFGDAPFFPDRVPVFVATQLTAVACAVRRRVDLPLGINVLRNDAPAALAVAHAAGGTFVRVNVLCGARVTDQGLLQGRAHELLRQRRQLDAGSIRILADVAVKHSAPLADRPLTEEARETLDRGLADGLIVSGSSTGRPPRPEQLTILRQARHDAVLLVGSGMEADNVAQYAELADALIVGSAFQRDGRAGNPVMRERVRAVLDRLGR